MENKCCECKKCKYYYNKSKCKRDKLNKHTKSINYDSSSDSSSDSSMRKQSIKIKVDCNRGGEDTIKPKQCIKNQENDYKDELLKYLISNKEKTIQPNLYQNNIKFISGIICPCLDNSHHHQIGHGYIADFIHTDINDQWIIKFEYSNIFTFILTDINNAVCNSAVIDNSSIETSTNFKPRFTNRVIINIKEPMYGFTFLALCN